MVVKQSSGRVGWAHLPFIVLLSPFFLCANLPQIILMLSQLPTDSGKCFTGSP